VEVQKHFHDFQAQASRGLQQGEVLTRQTIRNLQGSVGLQNQRHPHRLTIYLGLQQSSATPRPSRDSGPSAELNHLDDCSFAPHAMELPSTDVEHLDELI
jgi:hypothetical protein